MLYNYASIRESNVSTANATRKSSLQEQLEQAALSIELCSRPILCGHKVIEEAWESNIAILSEHSVARLVFLGNLPEEKIQEYRLYPLAHRIGFIHSIPEEIFKVDNATITDMNFLGLFPKSLLEVLRRYASNVKKESGIQDFDAFTSLIQKLISAVIYRPIVVQKVIQLLLTKEKLHLEQFTNEAGNSQNNANTSQCVNTTTTPSTYTSTTGPNTTDTHPASTPEITTCHADKCWLLQAMGIIRRTMYCPTGKICALVATLS
jgi:hypothetical protein